MTLPRALAVALLIVIAAAPLVPMGGMRQYVVHVLVQIFIWSFIGGAWSLMGRFGLVSLGQNGVAVNVLKECAIAEELG